MSKGDLYDQSASIYDSRYSEIQQEKYRQMLAGLELRGRVLDLGSGTGLLRRFLQVEVIGIDISFQMLKKASANDIQADAEQLPFPDKSFDYVLSFTMLQNIDQPELAIKEARRVLKQNSLFICTFLRAFKPKLKPLLEKHFKILEEKPCGEDVGFVLKQKFF